MKPIVALIGRPNVGKSTLFNRLTSSRDALVANIPGLTRDRIYGDAGTGGQKFTVIDTGGLSGEKDRIDILMASQAQQAIDEADILFFLVEARPGLQHEDREIAAQLRKRQKPVWLLVNKAEGLPPEEFAEFFELGLGDPIPISATRGDGIANLLRNAIPETEPVSEEEGEQTSVAIIGRPNVGKSSLINKLLGEERLLTFDQPGTTRDSVAVPFHYADRNFCLIDTAGVRRRGKVNETIEKFSVVKTLRAIEECNVVVLMIDASQDLAEQDLRLLSMALDRGKALVVAINKWDLLSREQRVVFKNNLDWKMPFLDFAAKEYISVFNGTNLGTLLKAVDSARKAAFSEFSPSKLTDLLQRITERNPPPMTGHNRIKLKYAHQGGKNPPLIVIHGNQTDAVPDNYRKYLENAFRELLSLQGSPVRIQFKTAGNPYEGKVNELTDRQLKKKHRHRRFVRKQSK